MILYYIHTCRKCLTDVVSQIVKGLTKLDPKFIDTDNEPRLFLQYFSHWLSTWNMDKSTCGKLTKETFVDLTHSTHALLEIGAKYVLLGKFQTDSFESRFGQYRQLAGGEYDVSLRQVLQV